MSWTSIFLVVCTGIFLALSWVMRPKPLSPREAHFQRIEEAARAAERAGGEVTDIREELKDIFGSIELKTLIQLFLTVALVGAALYVILSKDFASDEKRWAFGTIGTLIGYWLGQRARG